MPRKKLPTGIPLDDPPAAPKVKPPRVRKAVQSVSPGETPSESLLEDNQLVTTLELPTKAVRKPPVLDPSQSGLGSNAYSDTTMQAWFSQPRVKKHETGLDTWANAALVLAMRAKRASQTYGKKDFNALYRLVLSAGIAFDKAFPQQVQPLGGNLVIQLFGSLGSDTARRILEPARPLLTENVLEGKPLEVNQVGNNPISRIAEPEGEALPVMDNPDGESP